MLDRLAGDAQQFFHGGDDMPRLDGRIIDQVGDRGKQGILGHGVTGKGERHRDQIGAIRSKARAGMRGPACVLRPS
ncbi:hypothetical protein D3C72_1800820 [compost metagenome]